MKTKIITIILVVACVGLIIALFATKKQNEEQHAADVNSMLEFSNQLVGANSKVNELNQVNLALTNDLAYSLQQLALTRQLAGELSNSLASASATLESTRTALNAARDQIAGLNTQVSGLEQQNKALDQRASDLTSSLAQLNAAIQSTQKQLAVAETNRAFIEQQLQKQMAQKAELEHKFNDINEVRAQLKKLKEEIFIARCIRFDEVFMARRLQLMKNDNSSKKGAELLMQRPVTTTNSTASTRPSNFNLNVEVGSDGSVHVIPPLTNSAAH